jgi:hypothetical protein
LWGVGDFRATVEKAVMQSGTEPRDARLRDEDMEAIGNLPPTQWLHFRFSAALSSTAFNGTEVQWIDASVQKLASLRGSSESWTKHAVPFLRTAMPHSCLMWMHDEARRVLAEAIKGGKAEA